MSRPVAALLGVTNIVPLAYLWFFLTVMSNRTESGQMKDSPLELSMLMHLWVMCLIAVLAIIYIVVVLRTGNMSLLKRLLWAAAVGYASIFVFPIVWYRFVWRKHPEQTGGVSAL